ncbi:hypothetical protein FRB91_001151 [Serendipita sp. 411]|nr:hypothetical protein FRB91_001151 [Serendipita sp. 411]
MSTLPTYHLQSSDEPESLELVTRSMTPQPPTVENVAKAHRLGRSSSLGRDRDRRLRKREWVRRQSSSDGSSIASIDLLDASATGNETQEGITASSGTRVYQFNFQVSN